MNKKTINVWWDKEGDFLDVTWEVKAGVFVDTKDGNASIKMDYHGNVIGFQILGLSRFDKPVSIDLEPAPDEEEKDEVSR